MSALACSLTFDVHAAAPADPATPVIVAPHAHAQQIASLVRRAPATWWAEDALIVVQAIASRMAEHNKAFPPHAAAIEALDDCCETLDAVLRGDL